MSSETSTGHAGAMKNGASVARDAYFSSSSAPARLRLTHRGRIVFGGLGALVLVGLLAFATLLLSPQAFAADVAAGGQRFHYVVAQPGDSLWSVASELDPDSDPRDLIAEIVKLNQLGDSGVEAGQAIAVPLRYSDSQNVVSVDSAGGDVAAPGASNAPVS